MGGMICLGEGILRFWSIGELWWFEGEWCWIGYLQSICLNAKWSRQKKVERVELGPHRCGSNTCAWRGSVMAVHYHFPTPTGVVCTVFAYQVLVVHRISKISASFSKPDFIDKTGCIDETCCIGKTSCSLEVVKCSASWFWQFNQVTCCRFDMSTLQHTTTM